MTEKQTVKFGDICREVKLTTKDPIADGYERYIGLEHLDTGSLEIRRWGRIAEDKPSFTRVFKKGQILFGKRRPYLKKAAIADFNGVCSGDIIVLEPKNSQIDMELLPFIIQSDFFWSVAVSTSSGSLSPRTKYSALASYTFNINNDIDVRTCLKLLGLCRYSSEKLHELKNSAETLLKSTYLKYFQNFYERGPSQITMPEKWRTASLGELLFSVPQSGYSANEVSETTGCYVLNLNNLSTLGFVDGELKPIDSVELREKLLLNHGDFLISRANTHELVGLAGIYRSREKSVIFPDTMMRLDVNESIVVKEFLEAYLLSPYGRRAIQRIAAGTSGSMKKINKENLVKVKIPLPPLERQVEIVHAISSIRAFYRDIDLHCNIVKNLRNELVKKVLS